MGIFASTTARITNDEGHSSSIMKKDVSPAPTAGTSGDGGASYAVASPESVNAVRKKLDAWGVRKVCKSFSLVEPKEKIAQYPDHDLKLLCHDKMEKLAKRLASGTSLMNHKSLSHLWNTEGSVPIKIVLVGQPGIFMRAGARAKGYKFNAMHAALQFANTLVDWCNQSLVYPRGIQSNNAFIAIDIGTLQMPRDRPLVEEVFNMMARWNITETYDQKTKNCQHWVDDAVKILKFKLPKPDEGQIGQLLDWVRKGHLDKSVPSLTQIDPSAPMGFKNHEQLDKYVIQLMEKMYGKEKPTQDALKEFEQHPEFRDVYKILKGFDRAFRMLQVCEPDSPVGKCYSVDGRESCPFPFNERTKFEMGVAKGCSVNSSSVMS
eukprot:TRINITY_DN11630_c0_g1_i1.p1 TRINITY_DN11630_c0_g1~~TRINITY_DN11630_c0_g1_i1.p1  ORF type:complete len:377 (-),score=68.82 TRINITY_DN11630_c0_g1_i1:88-1218(-)